MFRPPRSGGKVEVHIQIKIGQDMENVLLGLDFIHVLTDLDLDGVICQLLNAFAIVVVYNHDCEGIEELADYPIQIKIGQDMENVLLGLDFILFAQTIALMKSLSLGITPDNPCPTGEVNRVVKGVTLYPYTLK